MWRGAVFKRIEHAGEFALQSLLVVTGDLEGLVHDLGQVIADGARRELNAVANDVVLMGQHLERLLGLERLKTSLGHRKRIVAEVDLAFGLVKLEHRIIDNPAKVEALLLQEIEFVADPLAGQPGQPCRLERLATGEKYAVLVAEAQLLAQFIGPLPAQIFCYRPLGFTARDIDIAKPGVTFAARPIVQFIEKAAWPGPCPGRRDGPHDRSSFNELGEHAKVGSPKDFSNIGDLDRIAQIRLVGTVSEHCLLVRDARKRRRTDLLVRKLLEQTDHHRLDGFEHILLGDEGHLHVELIEFAGRAVGPCVFVAKARRDLEIAVKPGHHDQLLELLGRLGERVEPAGMQPRRHQKVARAFG